MDWRLAVFLGVLQGVTEFLPVSSSGHLVLAQHYLGFPDGGGAAPLFFDGMLHVGTLVAVLLYFGRELLAHLAQHDPQLAALEGNPRPVDRRSLVGKGLRLVLLVGVASLPAVIAVLLFGKQVRASFKDPQMVAVCLVVLGGVLAASDRIRPGKTDWKETTLWQALLVGCGQALSALFRGLSRSGMTITAALLAGLERTWAVRFSFLMSLVASLGLGVVGIREALADPTQEEWLTGEFVALTLLATAISAVVGYLSIGPLIRVVRKARLWWFSVYLWLVGLTVLIVEWNR
ncbi:MAG: undecaprenyl-diphosphate phosphatase [Gemmatales bacterium]|nr:undecaprenyl-diphosphate phosphatase [Gemmatales bacterium]MDW8388152.1 undecaprenyl-diphosphate phosphatase [Gemmatales bacterium]